MSATVHDNPNLFYKNTEYYASFLGAAVCELIDIGSAVHVGGRLHGRGVSPLESADGDLSVLVCSHHDDWDVHNERDITLSLPLPHDRQIPCKRAHRLGGDRIARDA